MSGPDDAGTGRDRSCSSDLTGRVLGSVSVVGEVCGDCEAGYVARRVWLASSGVESWTVIGPDNHPVGVVDEFLGWLTWIRRSPNTVEAYARDLRLFWTFLAARGVSWERVTVVELGKFAGWAREPAKNAGAIGERG